MTHIHSKACDGIAIVQYRELSTGELKEWRIAASTCPLRLDTEATIRSHWEQHFTAQKQFVSVQILPINDDRI